MNIIQPTALIIFSVLASGCSCIDMLIPRAVTPIEETYIIEINLQGNDTITKEIFCEKYYDAMCAERGNFWAEREVGLNSYVESSIFTINDSKLGVITFSAPAIRDLYKGKVIPLENIQLQINGIPQSLIRSNHNDHTYAPWLGVRDESNTVTLNYTYSVNGVMLSSMK